MVENNCSFCGRQTADLIYGTFGCICKDCATLANKIIDETEIKSVTSKNLDEIPKPEDMKKFLDQYVIGQDAAKEKICVAVYNHYKRLYSKTIIDDVEIEKSNIIMVGPTGTGKCVTADTKVTVRNKKTGEVETLSIDEFIKKIA